MTEDLVIKISESYDALAEAYTRELFNELEHKPMDRLLLDRFASRIPENGEVCDMGCGPGHVTLYLRTVGTQAWGLDVSARMIATAKKRSPNVSFYVGNMLSLTIPDCSLAGITAFYAIVNIPHDFLPTIFSEMARVLKPGGIILLAFHIGNETVHVNELWNQQISLNFYLFSPDVVRRQMENAGFEIEEIVERGPYAPSVEHQSHRAYIFARRQLLNEYFPDGT